MKIEAGPRRKKHLKYTYFSGCFTPPHPTLLFYLCLIVCVVDVFLSMDWNTHSITSSMTSAPLPPCPLMAIGSPLMEEIATSRSGRIKPDPEQTSWINLFSRKASDLLTPNVDLIHRWHHPRPYTQMTTHTHKTQNHSRGKHVKIQTSLQNQSARAGPPAPSWQALLALSYLCRVSVKTDRAQHSLTPRWNIFHSSES